MRRGKFEQAHRGTLLLDEIGEMDLRLQAKLLRALQEREIDRLGGGAPVKVDVRIIAATNRDLREAVAQGRFREDLYYRLNVLEFRVPPLRERRLDILPLARHFAARYARANGLPERPLSPGGGGSAARPRLAGQCAGAGEHHSPWRCCWRAAPLSGRRRWACRPAAPSRPPPRLPPPSRRRKQPRRGRARVVAALVGRRMEEVERELIMETLAHCFGNRTRAAEILGISIRTLRNKLAEYRSAGIPVPPPPGAAAFPLPHPPGG